MQYFRLKNAFSKHPIAQLLVFVCMCECERETAGTRRTSNSNNTNAHSPTNSIYSIYSIRIHKKKYLQTQFIHAIQYKIQTACFNGMVGTTMRIYSTKDIHTLYAIIHQLSNYQQYNGKNYRRIEKMEHICACLTNC